MNITQGNPRLRRSEGLVASAVLALSLALGGCAAATTEQGPPAPSPLGDVTTRVKFDAAAGENPENIVIDGDSLIVSLMGAALGDAPGGAPSIVRVASTGQQTVMATGQVGETFTGVTLGSDDIVYFNVVSEDATRAGIWAIAPGEEPVRAAALPLGAFPNGLAFDGENALYAADSMLSTIWKVTLSDGIAKPWLEDPSLALLTDATVPLGANGIRFHKSSIWVSNISTGTLIEVPIEDDGPGRSRVVTDQLGGVDDFGFLSEDSSTVLATLNAPNELILVCGNGHTSSVLDESDGLSSPTSVAIEGRTVYVTNAGLAEPFAASILRARIDAEAPSC